MPRKSIDALAKWHALRLGVVLVFERHLLPTKGDLLPSWGGGVVWLLCDGLPPLKRWPSH